MRFDISKKQAHILFNPRMPASEAERWRAFLLKSDLHDHFWLATSGSSGGIKWAALSREAILTSAGSVNAHLKSTSGDVWINPLPLYHVGGLGIEARAQMIGARSLLFEGKWNPRRFAEEAHQCRATLTSLVPAQLFDLVQQEVQAPASLRGAVIGGGSLSRQLYEEGNRLGWHPLPSYGMTECSSQIATAESGSPKMRILPHVELKQVADGMLAIKSKSLLTTYAFEEEGRLVIRDPKEEGLYVTEDRVSLSGEFLTVLGRDFHFIKIGGESVNLANLERLAESLRLELQIVDDFALTSVPDARLGCVVALVAAGPMESLVEAFNSRAMPFERIREVITVEAIPRTALGKVDRAELHGLIRK